MAPSWCVTSTKKGHLWQHVITLYEVPVSLSFHLSESTQASILSGSIFAASVPISVFAVTRFYQLTGSHFMVMVLFEIVVLLVEPRA